MMNAPERLAQRIALPTAAGIETHVLRSPRAFPARPTRAFNRIAYSAVHLVAYARAASAALGKPVAGRVAAFRDILAPTVPLSRHLFCAPTRFYKTGGVLLAWLIAHQDRFTMVGGQQSARSILHLAEAFRLANAAGRLRDPDKACVRCARCLPRMALWPDIGQ